MQKAGVIMILRLSLELPEDLSYVRITRTLGRALLEHLQADRADIDDIEMLVGELCGNVIRHAQSVSGRFCVVLEYHNDHVLLMVKDKGQGFAFKDVPAVGTTRADFNGQMRIGGFGLKLVEGLADHLEFRRSDPQGTTVYAEKKLHYRTEDAAVAAAHLNEGDGVATMNIR